MGKNKNIENQIRFAFNCHDNLDLLKKDEYEDLNHSIVRYDIDTIRKFLPLLLIYEIHKDDKSIFSGTGDQLIYFLDGDLLDEKQDIKNNNGLQSYKFSKTFNENLFDKFTIDEATAILRWLEEIAFPKYKDLCEKDIESAISFWRKKVTAEANL